MSKEKLMKNSFCDYSNTSGTVFCEQEKFKNKIFLLICDEILVS